MIEKFNPEPDPEAVKHGVKDYHRGISVHNNPYKWEQSNRDLAWQHGWRQAEKEKINS